MVTRDLRTRQIEAARVALGWDYDGLVGDDGAEGYRTQMLARLEDVVDAVMAETRQSIPARTTANPRRFRCLT